MGRLIGWEMSWSANRRSSRLSPRSSSRPSLRCLDTNFLCPPLFTLLKLPAGLFNAYSIRQNRVHYWCYSIEASISSFSYQAEKKSATAYLQSFVYPSSHFALNLSSARLNFQLI